AKNQRGEILTFDCQSRPQCRFDREIGNGCPSPSSVGMGLRFQPFGVVRRTIPGMRCAPEFVSTMPASGATNTHLPAESLKVGTFKKGGKQMPEPAQDNSSRPILRLDFSDFWPEFS